MSSHVETTISRTARSRYAFDFVVTMTHIHSSGCIMEFEDAGVNGQSIRFVLPVLKLV